MNTMRKFLLPLVLCFLLPGCVVVSLHRTRPMVVQLSHKNSGKPVANAEIRIRYWYIGYGVFYILRVPDDASARTDQMGIAILPMADFMSNITVTVNGEGTTVNADLIRNGGTATTGHVNDKIADGKPHWVSTDIVMKLTPKK